MHTAYGCPMTSLLARLAARRAERADRRIPRDGHGNKMVRIALPRSIAREIVVEAPYWGAHDLKKAIEPYTYNGAYLYVTVAQRDLIRRILRSETVV